MSVNDSATKEKKGMLARTLGEAGEGERGKKCLIGSTCMMFVRSRDGQVKSKARRIKLDSSDSLHAEIRVKY